MKLADLPDEILLVWLQEEKKFSKLGAKQALNNFWESMKFAGLDINTNYDRTKRFNDAMELTELGGIDFPIS